MPDQVVAQLELDLAHISNKRFQANADFQPIDCISPRKIFQATNHKLSNFSQFAHN